MFVSNLVTFVCVFITGGRRLAFWGYTMVVYYGFIYCIVYDGYMIVVYGGCVVVASVELGSK